MRCANKNNLIRGPLFALTIALTAGMFSNLAQAGSGSDRRFESIAHRFTEQLLKTHPEAATALGDHRFDARVGDYTQRGLEADRALYHSTLDALAAVPATGLSSDNRVDRLILQNELQARLFDLEVMKVPTHDPMYYNVSNGIYALLARDFAPLKTRLASVQGRLQAIPAVLAAARHNLDNPPRVFTETAIQQNKGAIALVKGELDEFLKQEPGMRAALAPARKAAVAALTAYGTWLEKDLLARSNGNFRIGKDKYRKKLRFALDSDLAPEEILSKAEAELKTTEAAMLDTALPLYRRYFPGQPTDGVDGKIIIKAVLDKLAETRPDNATIVEQAKQKLAEATTFVRQHNLMTLPQDPVQVIMMPEFARGVIVAYCDSAGALEKNGTSFYAIAPTPADWTPQRTTSFFKEYNNAMLNDLTVHEAMPGHYLQLSIANKTKSRTGIRGLFASGTFVEGWATYAEQVMAQAGFGGPETRMQQLKMRLRLVINAILDQKIHASNMSEQEAMALMMNDGYQEDGEAAGKWRRAQLTPTQLSTYFVGNLEVNALVQDLQHKAGGDMKSVHDRMLASGSIGTKYIRQLNGL